MKYKNILLLGAALLFSVSIVHADSIDWGIMGGGDDAISPKLVVGDFSHTYEFTLTDAASLIVKADEFNCRCSKLNIKDDTFSMVLKDSIGNAWSDKGGTSLMLSLEDLAAGNYALSIAGTGDGQLFAAKNIGVYEVGVSVVPIPGAILLFGSGLVGLGGVFRSNRG